MLPKANDEDGPDVGFGVVGARLLFAPFFEASKTRDEVCVGRRRRYAPQPFDNPMPAGENGGGQIASNTTARETR